MEREVSEREGEQTEVGRERMTLSERYFLRRLQRGDERAFRHFVQMHEDRIYSFILRMLGDTAEAEDLSQEVFLAVHQNLSKFRGDCRLSTWLYRMAKNRCLNRLEYLARRIHDEEPDHDRHAHDDAFTIRPARPDEAVLAQEARDEVQRALAKLSDEHRLLIVMRDIEGLGYEQISHITELPLGTVKSRIHRARTALAALLDEAGMAPERARMPGGV